MGRALFNQSRGMPRTPDERGLLDRGCSTRIGVSGGSAPRGEFSRSCLFLQCCRTVWYHICFPYFFVAHRLSPIWLSGLDASDLPPFSLPPVASWIGTSKRTRETLDGYRVTARTTRSTARAARRLPRIWMAILSTRSGLFWLGWLGWLLCSFFPFPNHRMR